MGWLLFLACWLLLGLSVALFIGPILRANSRHYRPASPLRIKGRG